MTTIGIQNESTRLAWLENVLTNLPSGLRLLDAGAGERQFAKFCSHLDYVAQDFAAYNGEGDGKGLQMGSWDQTQLDIISDITAIPELNASFDVILCVEVFEHLPDPIAALKEFSRLLRSGGQLIITAPFCSLTHFAPYHFYSGFNRYFYETHLPAQGFKIVEMTENGDFFEYVAQEIRRLPFMVEHYTQNVLQNQDSLALDSMLEILERVAIDGQKSAELLCFGYHVLAVKQSGEPVRSLTTANTVSPLSPKDLSQRSLGLAAQNLDGVPLSQKLNVVIFSKDRSCQLELLLRSIKIFFKDWHHYQFTILYTYSDPTYDEGYKKLKELHPEFNYVCEREHPLPFKQHVLDLIQDTHPYTVFFVDDNVVRQPFDLCSDAFQIFESDRSIVSLSLRLSPDITYSYSTNKPASSPHFEPNLVWNWREMPADNDWGYPMSLDGHIFRTEQIKPLIEQAEFYNPNLLEAELAKIPIDLPSMICYSHSKVVNIPANRVQSTHANRHGNLVSPAEFNREFLDGKLISLKSILDLQNIAVHQEVTFQLRKSVERSANPKISVVVSSHNQSQNLPQIVENLLMQTYQDFEVIIVDQGSTDDTQAIAEALISAYPHDRIQLLCLENCEPEVAHDRTLNVAVGAYKLWLDAEQVISSTLLIEYLNLIELAPSKEIEPVILSRFYEWQKMQGELERSQCQLQSHLRQTHAGLEQSMQEVQQNQVESQAQLQRALQESAQLYEQLQQAHSQLEQTRSQLGLTQDKLVQAHSTIASMESSKLWKLRSRWFKLRRLIGIENDAQGLSPKTVLRGLRTTLKAIASQPLQQQPWLSDKPLVSIIIPCFNYGQYLEAAIDSVLLQTFQDFEIIVVDDGSEDALTLEVLEHLNKPKTKLIRQSNQKLPSARNSGIKIAEGKYICCLDADDLLRLTYLEKCLIRLETANLDVCHTWIQEFGDSCAVWNPGQFDLRTLVHQNCVAVSAVFKRAVWEKVGGYDEKMVNGYEDWNFWIAIAKLGAVGAQINEPLFLYRKHGSSMIDAALEKHEALCKQIQENHQELYSDRRLVKRIRQGRQTYIVENGYINLIQRFSETAQPQKLGKNSKVGNILFALPWLVIGGADTVLTQLMQALKFEYGITICTTMKPAPEMGDSTPKYEELTSGIYHLQQFLKPETWQEFIFYLIESRNIDIIFLAGSSYVYTLLPEIKRQFPHIKVIDQLYNEHGHIDNNRKYRNYIDLNIVENETVENCLLTEYQESNTKIHLIHNGVSTTYFNADSAVNDSVTSVELETATRGKFVISFMGRFSEEKCPESFVEIANRLQGDRDLHFVMAGHGALYEKVAGLIRRYGIAHNISLPGFMDAKTCLALSNVLVLPSQIDGRPNVVLESLSMGVPVIASAVGGLPQIIENGRNGFLCQSGDIADFVNRIKEMVDDRTLYLNMKQNARAYAISDLDISVMQRKYLDTFQHLLSSNPAPAKPD